MRTLYLVRHAKSSWADPGMPDHDRPLNERGLRNAPFMAQLFAARGEPVDLIVSSTAARALATARTFAAALTLPPESTVLEPAIYDASCGRLMSVVNALPPDAHRVMLFGHNPGFSELAFHLDEHWTDALPTCGILRIDLLLDGWDTVVRNSGTVVWADRPRAHPGQG